MNKNKINKIDKIDKLSYIISYSIGIIVLFSIFDKLFLFGYNITSVISIILIPLLMVLICTIGALILSDIILRILSE